MQLSIGPPIYYDHILDPELQHVHVHVGLATERSNSLCISMHAVFHYASWYKHALRDIHKVSMHAVSCKQWYREMNDMNEGAAKKGEWQY